jgi:hypothetical protein
VPEPVEKRVDAGIVQPLNRRIAIALAIDPHSVLMPHVPVVL